jgi:imidazolonepropionase-like amidohydrolase
MAVHIVQLSRSTVCIAMENSLRDILSMSEAKCRPWRVTRMSRRLGSKIVFGIAGFFAAATGLWSQTVPIVAIRAGRLFDSNSGQELTRQVLIVQGDRIAGVEPEDRTKIPPGTLVIDLSHATVLPGLIDGHSHIYDSLSNGQRVTTTNEAWTLLALKEAQSDLRAGFTTMRDCGTHGEGYGDVDVRNAINRGLFDGPRLQVSTRGIGAGGSAFIGMPGINLTGGNADIHGADEARQAVREQLRYGADWIKVFPTGGYSFNANGEIFFDPTLTLDELKAIVDEAHRHNHRVAAHAYGGDGLRNAIEAGVDTIEHGQGLDDAMVEMMVQRGIYYDPTGIRYSLPSIDAADRRSTGGKYSIVPIFEKNARAAITHKGLKVMFGSGVDGDTYAHGTQGRDFEWLVKHGMTPAGAIQAATLVDSEVLGWQDRVGSIEKGKYADIIAVSGDPLQDITELQRVKFVMTGGKIIKDELGDQNARGLQSGAK